ncbi:MAG: hypothetical protein MJ183_05020 [Treponemataceae bacterium]|nr:hypothetical protein [Treponemataceae bacterium]
MKRFSVFFAVLFAVFAASPLFALPGITQIMPEQNGAFVYYRDTTFIEETYIGVFQYDSSTYALRFYSPQVSSGSSDIILFVTLNPETDYVQVLGDSIYGTDSTEDTDKINYLYDLLYELASRRKKLDSRYFGEPVVVSEDYAAFNGTVTMTFRYDIPLFNLESIVSEEGLPLFTLVAKKISDTTDYDFFAFSGIPELPDTLKNSGSIPEKSAEELDRSWEISIDDGSMSLSFIGGDAVHFFSFMEFQVDPEDDVPALTLLEQTAIMGSSSTSSYWSCTEYAEIILDDDCLFMKVPEYSSGSWYMHYILCTSVDETAFAFSELTVSEKLYSQNPAYFDSYLF